MKAVLVFTVALSLFAAAGLADEPRETVVAPSDDPTYPTDCTTDCFVPLAEPAVDEFPVSAPSMEPYVAMTEAVGFSMRRAGTTSEKAGAILEGVAMHMVYADARPCNSSEYTQAYGHCDAKHAPWWGNCRITGCLVRNGWVVYSWSGYTLSLPGGGAE